MTITSLIKFSKCRSLIVTIMAVALAAGPVLAQNRSMGKVAGTVFDTYEAVIPGVDITIQNAGFQKTVRSDNNGTFQVTVPVGIYNISTATGISFPLRRARFIVQADQTTVINFEPTQRVMSAALAVTKNGMRDIYDYNKAPKYDDFQPFSDSTLNIVVEYRKRSRKGSITEYRDAKLTFNSQSVKADTVRLDSRTHRVEATGNVKMDNNGVREASRETTFNIANIETAANSKLQN